MVPPVAAMTAEMVGREATVEVTRAEVLQEVMRVAGRVAAARETAAMVAAARVAAAKVAAAMAAAAMVAAAMVAAVTATGTASNRTEKTDSPTLASRPGCAEQRAWHHMRHSRRSGHVKGIVLRMVQSVESRADAYGRY